MSDHNEPIFFSTALRAAHISSTVTVRGVSYRVKNGEVTIMDGTPITGSRALAALRLAYAQTTARRAPLLALPGVDPDKLKSAVAKLEASQQTIISMQATSSDAQLLASLYPLQFLATLPLLEEARRQFIASGSDADLHRYHAALHASLEAQAADIDAFSNAFNGALKRKGEQKITMPGFGGSITSDALIAGTANVRERVQEVQALQAAREACFAGTYAKCELADIKLPALPDSLPTSELPKSMRAQVQDIRSMIDSLVQMPQPSRTIVLSSSFCLAALPGPYAFLDNAEILGVNALNDIFFQPINAATEKQSPHLTYLAKTYKISHQKMSPMLFYMCPTIGGDTGRIRAIEQIDAFAGAHPSIAKAESAVLRTAPELREDYAVAYLRAALTEAATSTPEQNELTDLALMYLDRAAGLDEIISIIALTNSHQAALVARGVPFGGFKWEMFFSHSAYPTLFLSLNPSAGTSSVALQTPDKTNRDHLLKKFVPYSSLKSSLSRDEILHNLRAFMLSEGAEPRL